MVAHPLGISAMSASCCSDSACSSAPPVDPTVRRVLWVALVLNALMFGVEFSASWLSGSVSLLADSIDFFGDAANYAISLAVLGMSLAARAKAAIFKAVCMGAFGVFVLGRALWSLQWGVPPEAITMGAVGFAALAVNAGVAFMLYRYRGGDANMRSVWICSRNDALGQRGRDVRRARRVRHRDRMARSAGRVRDGRAGTEWWMDGAEAGPVGDARAASGGCHRFNIGTPAPTIAEPVTLHS